MPKWDIREYKRSIREKYKKIRADIPDALRSEKNAAILRRFLGLRQYKSCETLLTYVSIGSEADTRALIDAALADGKRVAVPKSLPDTLELRFYYISSADELSAGVYGVPEPDATKALPVEEFSGCICVVPALVYDSCGYRMGYGKGYYDRFLHGCDCPKLGLAFSECLCRSLPRGKFDTAVDLIVSDSRLVRPRQDPFRNTFANPLLHR